MDKLGEAPPEITEKAKKALVYLAMNETCSMRALSLKFDLGCWWISYILIDFFEAVNFEDFWNPLIIKIKEDCKIEVLLRYG